MTETKKHSVVEALSKVMSEVQAVGKGSTNTQQGYRFRGIDAVVNEVGPALRKHGVIMLPTVEDVHYNVVEVGKQRTLMRECTVRVRYAFHGPAGDVIECVSIGEAMDSGDKATPKAMSVAYRVALLQALCIPTDEPDADSQSYERSAPAQQPAWDAGEQQSLREAYESEIAKASTEEIAEIGKRVQNARRDGLLSPTTYGHLAKAGAARKAELNGGEQSASADRGQSAQVQEVQ